MDRVDNYDSLIYGIIYKCFKYYKSKEDLYQAGYLGLLQALNNYDESIGTKFTTYAYPYIYGEMFKQVNNDKSLKVDRKTNTLYLKITKASALLSQKLMHEPSIEEIAEFLEIDDYLVINALSSSAEILNIDDKQVGYQDDLIENMALNEELNKLSLEELNIIDKRYKRDLTQSEVALQMGITQVQVCRKEKKILEKLKSKLI